MTEQFRADFVDLVLAFVAGGALVLLALLLVAMALAPAALAAALVVAVVA